MAFTIYKRKKTGGRKRVYENDADRSRAYRSRKRLALEFEIIEQLLQEEEWKEQDKILELQRHIEYDNGPWWQQRGSVHTRVNEDEPE